MKSYIVKKLLQIVEIVLKKHVGEKKYQYLYEKFYKLSLIGKNIYPGDLETSGEKNVLNIIKDKIGSKVIIFDVGANIGKYSKQIFKVFKEDAKIYSFEPSKHSFEVLKNEMEFMNNVFCVNYGMSNVKQDEYLYFGKEKSGLSSLYKRDFSTKHIKKEKIKLSTIDIFCLENNLTKIDFLKLDVEGHELAVLKGCEKTLNNITFIQFEFGGCNISSRTFFKDFHELLNPSFQLYRVLKDGLYPIENYNEILECFLNQNYLAINRFLN